MLAHSEGDALPMATSHAEPYASKLTTAFGGLANSIRFVGDGVLDIPRIAAGCKKKKPPKKLSQLRTVLT